MNDFMIDFKQIETEDAALTIVEVFSESCIENNRLKQEIAKDFFSQCLTNLENPSINPKVKFYIIFMLKELSQRANITLKLFGPFSKHPLYDYIEDLALTVDPKKAVQQKGKSLFPSDKTTGNNFIRLILQSLLNWGSRFGSNKEKPNRFSLTIEKLEKAKIVLPSSFVYYSKKQEKGETPGLQKKQESKNSIKPDKGPTPSAPKVKQAKQKYASEVKFMFNKIQTLMSIMEDSDEAEEIRREVSSYHQKFQKDLEKLEKQQEEILDGQTEEIIGLYFKLLDFFNEEKGLYNLHFKNNDFATYISGYNIAFEKLFQTSKLKKPPAKQQPSIQNKIVQEKVAKTKSSLPPQSKSSVDKSKYDSNPYGSSKQKVEEKNVERENRFLQASKVVTNFFSKLETCSKSPQNGFKNLAKSMSREKQSAIVPKKRNPLAVSNFNKSKFGGSSMAKSRAQLKGIFASPPNPNLRPRNYEGELVLPLNQPDNIKESLLKQQGHRRFKVSHFKTKYILYEDEYVQIGFKVSQIYQKVEKFSAMMLFQVYFGNKIEKSLNKVSLNFQGDKQSLIYLSPQTIDPIIQQKSQFKLELMNIPKKIPFGHITIQLSFEVEWETHHISAYLPNSILQMVTYYNISPADFTKSWADCVKILKSETFLLSHYFPPNQLIALIPSLTEHTKYSDFSAQGSTTDYELYTQVIIQQSYQGILKINVRPDLTVVLQVGIFESEQNGLINFKFYLQALEMILKSENI